MLDVHFILLRTLKRFRSYIPPMLLTSKKPNSKINKMLIFSLNLYKKKIFI